MGRERALTFGDQGDERGVANQGHERLDWTIQSVQKELPRRHGGPKPDEGRPSVGKPTADEMCRTVAAGRRFLLFCRELELLVLGVLGDFGGRG